jgi:hypothetical protein
LSEHSTLNQKLNTKAVGHSKTKRPEALHTDLMVIEIRY